MLREVLDDAWSRFPVGLTSVTRSMPVERISKAAKDAERNPARCEPTQIAFSIEARLQSYRGEAAELV
jgi:hypothetical protein